MKVIYKIIIIYYYYYVISNNNFLAVFNYNWFLLEQKR